MSRLAVSPLAWIAVLLCALTHESSLYACAPYLKPSAYRQPGEKRVAERAEKLLELDEDAQRKFRREHPGVLPFDRLRLPKPTARTFDWCKLHKVPQPHTQKSKDCWVNAAIEALECSYWIRNNRHVALSQQPVLDVLEGSKKKSKRHGSSGTALEFLLKAGTARLSKYRYTGKPNKPKNIPLPYRAVAWGNVGHGKNPPNKDDLKTALLRFGPLPVSVLTTNRFHKYRHGVFAERRHTQSKSKTSHVVLLVGWDDARGKHGAWKIKNSWGKKWGEHGFMWIAYGSNNIGAKAHWVQASSLYYDIPSRDFKDLVSDARPLPRARFNRSLNVHSAAKMTK